MELSSANFWLSSSSSLLTSLIWLSRFSQLVGSLSQSMSWLLLAFFSLQLASLTYFSINLLRMSLRISISEISKHMVMLVTFLLSNLLSLTVLRYSCSICYKFSGSVSLTLVSQSSNLPSRYLFILSGQSKVILSGSTPQSSNRMGMFLRKRVQSSCVCCEPLIKFSNLYCIFLQILKKTIETMMVIRLSTSTMYTRFSSLILLQDDISLVNLAPQPNLWQQVPATALEMRLKESVRMKRSMRQQTAILMKVKNREMPEESLYSPQIYLMVKSSVVGQSMGSSIVLIGSLQHGQTEAGLPSLSMSELQPQTLAISWICACWMVAGKAQVWFMRSLLNQMRLLANLLRTDTPLIGDRLPLPLVLMSLNIKIALLSPVQQQPL